MDRFYHDAADSSTPHTPSPRLDDHHPLGPLADHQAAATKQHFAQRYQQPDIVYPPSAFQHPPNSLLHELYDDGPWSPDSHGHNNATMPPPHHHLTHHHLSPHAQQQQHHLNQLPSPHHHSIHNNLPHHHNANGPGALLAGPEAFRRASFPYVRGDVAFHEQPHTSYHLVDPTATNALYSEPDGVKLEPSPLVVPTQVPGPFYPRPSSSSSNGSSGIMPFGDYLPPHAALPVMHTDDAASKETQYLRRRCFNCHTTEPPSWRRSTLNPGKIVCNKCGLYERTHLRPRPQRFDELRASNKARKNSTGATPQQSPSPKGTPPSTIGSPPIEHHLLVKKEDGTSDWDDNLSVYSSSSSAVSSVPPSVYNSPLTSTFHLAGTASPPPSASDCSAAAAAVNGPAPIRLPNAPLTDIMGHGKAMSTPSPHLHHPHLWSPNGSPQVTPQRRHTLAGSEMGWTHSSHSSVDLSTPTTSTTPNAAPEDIVPKRERKTSVS